ncbi:NAD(P)-dependent oxidoreductase [Shewanella sp. TB7-MNA-CIBAN-0143]|jgi:nucleoside-diphosphate-sugar epimerase|uniref:NAD-dependent epimerase/dehydratase family protein n=1 Tax=unclassified Shewanella TaxID=196818 RepID=UPI00332C7792
MLHDVGKKVIIFGGSGFIGNHLICSLDNTVDTIISIDIKPPKNIVKNVEYIQADVRDLASLKVYKNIDVIYNLAAIHTTPGHEHHEYYETNIVGAIEVCKYAKKCNIKEIVFTSSISVYGPGEDQKVETTALKPTSSYGYSKKIAERIHRDWQQFDSNYKLTIVRPAVVFGHGEGGNFTRLATLLSKGWFIYPGRKDTIKACIYVGDLLNAIEFARGAHNDEVTFNGAYHHGYTLEDIINTFTKEHFPKVNTFLVPKFIVLAAAKAFRLFNALNIGIHPDRVMKLVQSTNIYPQWLVDNGKTFDDGLVRALAEWKKDSSGTFK